MTAINRSYVEVGTKLLLLNKVIRASIYTWFRFLPKAAALT